MSFKIKMTTATMAACIAFAAAPASAANILFPDYEEFKSHTVTGSDFNAELARQYQTLSAYEYEEMYDYIDAETYAERGMMAEKDISPSPFKPEEWSIDDPSAMKELQAARVELIGALQKGAGNIAPGRAANAQAKFDCWVEQQEEGWQTDHIAQCREGFRAAMLDLHEAMMPKKAEAEPAAPVAKTEPLALPPRVELSREVIYFDFDDATLTQSAERKIRLLTESIADLDDINVHVEGHADRAGPSDYNKALSEKRAENVRNALIANGLPTSKLKRMLTDSEGETDPAVATADGVREARNRRVEISVTGFEQKTASTQ
ncbi:OmpA family protein [Hwanghaeella grinnelliae]|uniref:OmpA family protein n=1 Tax=Hwanghaeella grinnelliae TaxID=2500179 RepID=A0A437QX42_9PROT|nr:OmpA family protein [Hwanghaeella grinnelliae]RVU39003.1 OmpA family protein [Hwanghaeella grinnelliae]